MSIELQYKIKNNPLYKQYLRENSLWYKYLNRNDSNFQYFEKALKDQYQLKPSDRFNKVLNNINMLQTFLDVLK